MLDFLGCISAYWAGLPSLYLLLFVLVIWVVFALILLADARNKLNQWCFIGGMAFSVGVFKEYLYYGIGPSLIASGAWTVSGAQLLYSILSAAFYLLSIPCVLMFAFYFARLNQTRVFPLLRVAVWLPAVYLGLLFPPVRTLPLQSNPVFCLSIAGYNWLGGGIASAVILCALRSDRRSSLYRQRRLVAVSILLPLWTALLDEQMPGNREVDIIRHSVEHLRALICRTKTHTDRVTLEPDFCDVRALFEQLIHETPHAPALTLEVAACDDAPLFCDKTHIHETLTNLISNASEAMRGSGRITLSYTHAKAARKAVISVSDNGPGMTPEQQKRIFEPYFTTKSSGENFGLGLYYCQNVMNAHGGSITVRSTPGEGSTFSLRFHSSPEERTRP